MQVVVQTAGNEKERATDVIDLKFNTVAVETKLSLDISETKLTSETTNTHFTQHEDGNSNYSGVYTKNLNNFQTIVYYVPRHTMRVIA